jgi:hypothetical protein
LETEGKYKAMNKAEAVDVLAFQPAVNGGILFIKDRALLCSKPTGAA